MAASNSCTAAHCVVMTEVRKELILAIPIDCNVQKKNTGSKIKFCSLASSIEITFMSVAIEPRRFGKHKIYHIILQEMRKQCFGSCSSGS